MKMWPLVSLIALTIVHGDVVFSQIPWAFLKCPGRAEHNGGSQSSLISSPRCSFPSIPGPDVLPVLMQHVGLLLDSTWHREHGKP